LKDGVQQSPALEDHHVHEERSADLSEAARRHQGENKWTDYVEDGTVQGVEQSKQRVGER
jgi:hypothetical protein